MSFSLRPLRLALSLDTAGSSLALSLHAPVRRFMSHFMMAECISYSYFSDSGLLSENKEVGAKKASEIRLACLSRVLHSNQIEM